MKTESVSQMVSELSPQEQAAVREFIVYLKQRHGQPAASTDTSAHSFESALDEFISAHSELLRRLAQ